MGLDGEVNFSLTGTSFGVMSSVFVCLNAIFTRSCLDAVNSTTAWAVLCFSSLSHCSCQPCTVCGLPSERVRGVACLLCPR